MSYTPHEWQDDESITAEKLNNIEEGVRAGEGYDIVFLYEEIDDGGDDFPQSINPGSLKLSGNLTKSYNGSANFDLTIIDGSADDVVDKIMNHVPPNAALFWESTDGFREVTSSKSFKVIPDGLGDFILAIEFVQYELYAFWESHYNTWSIGDAPTGSDPSLQ